jgi:hypothetical protein
MALFGAASAESSLKSTEISREIKARSKVSVSLYMIVRLREQRLDFQ